MYQNKPKVTPKTQNSRCIDNLDCFLEYKTSFFILMDSLVECVYIANQHGHDITLKELLIRYGYTTE